MRDELLDAGTFEVRPGQGLLGGDLECNETLVPGRCAVASVSRAAILCGTQPDCDTVVYHAAGALLWGCSQRDEPRGVRGVPRIPILH